MEELGSQIQSAESATNSFYLAHQLERLLNILHRLNADLETAKKIRQAER